MGIWIVVAQRIDDETESCWFFEDEFQATCAYELAVELGLDSAIHADYVTDFEEFKAWLTNTSG